MGSDQKATPIQHAKILAMLYGFLCLFIAILFFSTGWIASNTAEQRLRAFMLIWFASLFTIPIVLEMLRCLVKSGMNPLPVACIGILNIPFVGMMLAVYADLIVFDIADSPILMVVLYLVFSAAGLLFVFLWMLWEYRKRKKVEASE